MRPLLVQLLERREKRESIYVYIYERERETTSGGAPELEQHFVSKRTRHMISRTAGRVPGHAHDYLAY